MLRPFDDFVACRRRVLRLDTGILSLDITLSTTESSVEPKNAPPAGDKIVEWTQHDYSNDWDYVNPDGSLG